MQVSFACTEHNLKSRSEDRLCGLRTAPPPGGSSGGVGGGGGGGGGGGSGGGSGQGSNGNYTSQGSVKTREGSGSRQTPQGHAHMKEAIGRHSNMKYRWVWIKGGAGASGLNGSFSSVGSESGFGYLISAWSSYSRLSYSAFFGKTLHQEQRGRWWKQVFCHDRAQAAWPSYSCLCLCWGESEVTWHQGAHYDLIARSTCSFAR